jgi:pilus assembly protein Flp/PilA
MLSSLPISADEELSVMTKAFRCFVANESGATAIEYGLIAALVSLFAGGLIAVLGDVVSGLWAWIGDSVATVAAGAVS